MTYLSTIYHFVSQMLLILVVINLTTALKSISFSIAQNRILSLGLMQLSREENLWFIYCELLCVGEPDGLRDMPRVVSIDEMTSATTDVQ